MPKDDIIYYLSLVAQEFAGGVGQIFTFNSIDDIYNKNNPRSSYDEALKVRNFFKEKFNISKNLVEGKNFKKEESILNLLGYRVSEKPVNSKYRVILKRDSTSIYDEFDTKEEAEARATELNKNILSKKLGTQITPQQKQQALQLYSQYLDQIFPDSKVKDIVYHQTDNKFDTFVKRFSKELGYDVAIYFSKLKKDITVFGVDLDEGGNTKYEIAAIVNSQTPIQSDSLEVSKYGNLKQINLTQNDSLIINQKSAKERGVEAFSDAPAINWVAVKEPEQIHILGSKQDIEGFKEFVGKNKVIISPPGLPSLDITDINSCGI
jgi:uncharacterized protein YeaO (DUF488 family)